jgi:hypothetical protein
MELSEESSSLGISIGRSFGFIAIACLLSVSIIACARGADVVYLYKNRDVRFVDGYGKDKQLTTDNTSYNTAVSSDGKTAAWIVPIRYADDVGFLDNGSSEVIVFRNGRQRSIKCEPFIRDLWFWKRGSYLGIDCGGAHFAGREILYVIATMKQVASSDQAKVMPEDRPEWSDSSRRFSGD